MKKIVMVLLSIVMLLSLCSCGEKEIVEIELGTSYTIDDNVTMELEDVLYSLGHFQGDDGYFNVLVKFNNRSKTKVKVVGHGNLNVDGADFDLGISTVDIDPLDSYIENFSYESSSSLLYDTHFYVITIEINNTIYKYTCDYVRKES